MNQTELSELIGSRMAGTTFFITQADLPSAEVSKMFKDFFTGDRIDLSFAQAEISETGIIVRGEMQQSFLFVEKLRAELFFSIVSENPQLKIRFTNFPSEWKFETSFPLLQNSALSEITFFQPQLILDSQNADPLPENFQTGWGYKADPALAHTQIFRGLSFEARIALRDMPGLFPWLLLGSSVQSFTVNGPIEIRNGIPKLWFRLKETWSFQLLNFSLPVQWHIVSLLPENEALRSVNLPLSFNRLETEIQTAINNAPLTIPMSASFSSCFCGIVNLESNMSDSAKPILLADLATLINMPDAATLIPTDLPLLQNLTLKKTGFDLLTESKRIFTSYVQIGTTTELNFFDGNIKLYDMRAQFTLVYPDPKTVQPSLSLLVKADFYENELEGFLTLPAYDLNVFLPPEKTLNLKPLLENSFDLPFEMPSVNFTNLNLWARIKEKSFSFSGTIEEEWAIDLGNESPVLKKIALEINHHSAVPPSSPASNTGSIYGEITIGEILFFARASLQTKEEGWIFEFGNFAGDIPLSKIITTLVAATGLSFSAPVPAISVANLNFRFAKKTKDVSLKGQVKTEGPVTIGPASFDVITYFELSSKTDSVTHKKNIAGNFESRISIGTALFTLRTEFGDQQKITGTWQSTEGEELGIADLVGLFGTDVLPSLPVEFSFTKASFSYIKDQKEFTLSAVSKQFGEAVFHAYQNSSKKWCFDFELKLGNLNSLNKSISEPLAIIGDIVKTVSLKISSPNGIKSWQIGFGVGIGLPKETNRIFGTDSKDEPLHNIFKTYDPQNPGYTIIDTNFSKDANGIKLQLLDSPLQTVEVKNENGKTWLPFDFGAYGAGCIETPTFSYNEAARSFLAAGAFEITKALAIPLSPLTSLLDSIGLGAVANLLPKAIPIRDISLLDSKGNISFAAFGIPKAVTDFLQPILSQASRLPDRFRSYFKFNVPERLSFEISYGQGMSNLIVKLKIPDGDPPIRFLLFAAGGFIGIEIQSISIGEVLRGKLTVIEVDGKADFFDLPTLIASVLIPSGFAGILPKTSDLQKTIVAKNLFAVMPAAIGAGRPVPLFYDEFSFSYLGIEGFKLHSAVHFPKPAGGMQAISSFLESMYGFITEKNKLLDPKNPPFTTPLNYTIGANYISLPPYLSGYTLGKKTTVATVSIYENLSHVLNWLKTFKLGEFIQSIPVEYRVNKFAFTFSFLSFEMAWLISSGKEFRGGVYKKILPDTKEAEEVFTMLPVPVAAPGSLPAVKDDDALIVLMKGATDLGFIKLDALYGAVASPSGNFGTAFRYSGMFLRFLALRLSGNILIDAEAKNGAYVKTGGALSMKIASKEIITGTFSVSDKEFTLNGMLDLFPSSSPVQIKGNLGGKISRTEFLLEGNSSIKIGALKIVEGNGRISKDGFEISGTWLGLSHRFAINENSGSVEVTATTKFEFELNIDITGLGSLLGRIPGLSGSADLSNIKASVTMQTTIGAGGFSARLSGNFGFAGQSVSFAAFTITVAPSDVQEVAEMVADKIADKIEDMAVDFAALVGMAAGVIADGAETAANATKDAAETAYREAAKIVGGAEDAAKATIGAAGVAAAEVGKAAEFVGGQIVNVGNDIAKVSTDIARYGQEAGAVLNTGIGAIKSGFSTIGNQAVKIGNAIGNFFSNFNPANWF